MRLFGLIAIFCLVVVVPAFADDLLIEQGTNGTFPIAIFGTAPFAEDPSVATLSVQDDMVVLKPLKLGATYIYGWNASDELVFRKIRVVVRGYTQALKDRQQYETTATEKSGNLKVTVGYKSGSGNSYLASVTTFNWNVFNVNTSAKTVWGDYLGVIQFERRDNVFNRMVLFTQQLRNTAFSVGIGDNWAVISDLTAPYLKYQGLQFYDVKLGNTSASFYVGRAGNSVWGKDIWSVPTSYRDFLGLKLNRAFSNDLSVFGTYFIVNRRVADKTTAVYGIGSVGFQKTFAPFSLGIELAESMFGSGINRFGMVSKLGYSKDRLSLSTQYRYVEPGFEALSDYTNFSSNNGFYNAAFYRLSDQFSLMGRYNVRRDPNATATIWERDASLLYQSPGFLSLQLTGAENDYRGLANSGVEKRVRFSVVQDYPYKTDWYLPSSLYFNIQRSLLTVSGADLYNTRSVGGIKNYFKPFYFTGEATYDTNSYLYQQSPLPLLTYSLAVATYDLIPLITGPFGLTLNLNGRAEQTYSNGLSYSWLLSGDAELRTVQTPYGQGFLRYASVKRSGSFSNLSSENQVSFGFENTFHTGVNLNVPNTQLTGLFFEDLNENGVRDEGEPILKGFEVVIEDRPYSADANGMFAINSVQPGWLMARSSIYSSYRLLANNPYRFDFNAVQKASFELPVVFVHRVKAIVFFDQNKNGIFDGQDHLIKQSKLYVNGGQGRSQVIENTDGTIEFEYSGRELTSLDIDLTSVNADLTPLSTDSLSQAMTYQDQQVVYYPFR